MSELEKLSIIGIRSFSPKTDENQVLSFAKPLTLILGENGAGKTTIIECLKYAVSGTQPPNTKSGQFIHDPKIAGSYEVKARVKLQFRDYSGRTCVAQRSISLTQKATKTEYKSLENLITISDLEGNKTSLSAKCAELDKEISFLLGVSKAVLNNVIFCHQEESNWPLSEPKALKMRFDDIFASTRFVKALDNLRKIRLAKMSEIKELEIEHKYLLENKARKEKLIDENNQLVKSKEEIEKKLEEFSTILAPLEYKLDDLNSKSEKIYQLKSSYESKIASKSHLETSISNLLAQLDNNELEDSDEILKQKFQNYNTSMEHEEREITKLEEQIEVESKNGQQMSVKEKNLISEKASFDMKINQVTELKNELSDKIKNAANNHNLTLNLSDSESIVDHGQFVELFQSKINEIASSNKSRKSQLVEIKQKIQTDYDDAKKSLFKTEQQIEGLNKSISESKNKIKKVKSELDDAENSDIIDSLKNEILKLSDKLQKLSDYELGADLNTKHANNNEKLKNLKHEIKTLSNEVASTESLLKFKEEFESSTNILKNSKSKLKSLKLKNSEKFTEIFNESISENFSNCLNEKNVAINSQIIEAMSEISKIEHDTLTCKQKRTDLREEIDRKRKSLQEKDDYIMDAGLTDKTGQNFSENLEKLKENLKVCEKSKSICEGAIYQYTAFKNALAENDPNCPICFRDFKSDDDLNTAVDYVNDRLSKLPLQSKSDCDEIQDLMHTIGMHEKYKPYLEEINNLRDAEIPSLTQEMSKVSGQLTANSEKQKSLTKKLGELKTLQATISGLSQDAISMDRSVDDISNAQKALESISISEEDKMSLSRYESVKNDLSQKRLEAEALQETNFTLYQKINSAQKEKSSVQDAINAKKSELMRKESQMMHKLNYQKDLEALEAEIRDKQSEIEVLKNAMPDLHYKVSVEKEKLQNSEAEISSLQSNYIQKVGQLKSLGDEINSLNDKIEDIEVEELIAQNSALAEELDQIATDKSELDGRIEKLSKKRNTIKTALSNKKFLQRKYSDNLNLRKYKSEMLDLTKEIQGLSKKLGEFTKINIESQRKSLMIKIENVKTEKSQIDGQIYSLQDQIVKNKNELQTDSMKTADSKYFSVFMDLSITKSIVKDIDKMSRALDNSIIAYHFSKMKEINQVMRDLWRMTYTGNDIDSIQIKVENDDDTSTSRARKSYLYRVVMIKNKSEMDMRSRCSAGQRVLACMIIRLALAEAFCTHCGILALDEPTTNLDAKNVTSLGSSLLRILRNRGQHKNNFQLVVITHDEEFIRALAHSGLTENYLKVMRNDKGLSQIFSEDISNLDI